MLLFNPFIFILWRVAFDIALHLILPLILTSDSRAMAQQHRYSTRLKSCDRRLPSIEPSVPLTAANLGMLEDIPSSIDVQEPGYVDLRSLL